MENVIAIALIIAVIVLIVRTNSMKHQLSALQREVSRLFERNRELNEKLLFLYNILKDMGAVPGFEKKNEAEADIEPVQAVSAQEDGSAQKEPVKIVASALKGNAPPRRAVHAAADLQEAQTGQEEMLSLKKAADNANADPVQNAAQAAPSPALKENVPPIRAASPYAAAQAPVQSIPAQPMNAAANNVITQPKPKKHIEEWLGARVFNIAASVLIFIGLVLFCTLGTDQVTNTMKMIAMFIVSGGFIAAGTFLARKDRSIFPLGMLGTGFGAFFISILLSHVYFHSLGEIAAFGLLLVWSALALYLSKRLDSVMLSVTAHIGTAVSVCFAYSLGFTAEKVLILTVYQFAAISVIIAGNIFCCRKTYRFGLIMSQCLLLYTSIAMSVAFGEKFIMPKSISAPAAAAIYAVQFAAICFISYLVAASASALEKEGLKKANVTARDEFELIESLELKKSGEKLISLATLIHAANKVLWSGGTVASVGCITYFICRNALHIGAVIPTTCAIAIAALLHLALTIVMEEKLSFSRSLASLSMWFISLMITAALMIGAYDIGLPFVFIYALLLVGIIKYTKNKGITPIAAAVLLLEGIYMCCFGYFKAENVWVSIPYMFGMGIVLLLLWFVQDGKEKQRYFKYMKISEYLWISASIIPINASQFSDISIPLIISEFALMNIICWFIKFGSENEPELRTVVKAESLLTLYIGILTLAFEYSADLGSNNIIKAVLCVMVLIITLIYAYDFAKSKATHLQIISALTVAGYMTSLAYGFSDHFKPFFIYADTLSCMPFVFVFTAVLLGEYIFTKNRRLTVFVWIGIIIDMLFMGLNGYCVLVDEVTYAAEHPGLGAHLIMTGISIAHAAAALAFSFIMNTTADDSKTGSLSRGISKFTSYFWVNIAFPTITYWAFYKTALHNDKAIITLIMLVLINTAVFAMNYQDKFNSPFNLCVRITSGIIFYTAMPFMETGSRSVKTYVILVILLLAVTALYFVRSRELMRNTRAAWAQVLVGINATILVNAACGALSGGFDLTYVFSIVTMLTALICITIGFISQAKGLRIYGLIVTMICIIKLVTVDISGADSVARVIAFMVGGIICFIISGIYNKMEKKFNAPVSVSVPVSAPVYEAVTQTAGEAEISAAYPEQAAQTSEETPAAVEKQADNTAQNTNEITS